MTTELRKPVYRVTVEQVRDKSKHRSLVIGLLPGDLIEIRLKGTRQAVAVPAVDVYWMGMKAKARQLAADRIAKRKAKRNT